MSSVQALWRRRDLAIVLAGSEFKSRYRRLGLGVIWAVLNPLIQGLIISLVFSFLRQQANLGNIPFFVFVLSGMMPWSFFVGALLGGTSSVTESGQVVQRVALPRAALPTAALLVQLYNFAFVMGTLLAIVAVAALSHLGQVWALPLVILVNVALVYGLTLLTSSLQVRYRDVGQLVGAVVLAWFWLTPIVYPMSLLANHPVVQLLVRANPMTGIISGYRAALLGLPIDRAAALFSVGWAAVALVVGWIVFARREATLADFL